MEDRRIGERRQRERRRVATFTCPNPACRERRASQVKDSRPLDSIDGANGDEARRRRHRCPACGARWSTVERIIRSSILIPAKIASHNL